MAYDEADLPDWSVCSEASKDFLLFERPDRLLITLGSRLDNLGLTNAGLTTLTALRVRRQLTGSIRFCGIRKRCLSHSCRRLQLSIRLGCSRYLGYILEVRLGIRRAGVLCLGCSFRELDQVIAALLLRGCCFLCR